MKIDFFLWTVDCGLDETNKSMEEATAMAERVTRFPLEAEKLGTNHLCAEMI